MTRHPRTKEEFLRNIKTLKMFGKKYNSYNIYMLMGSCADFLNDKPFNRKEYATVDDMLHFVPKSFDPSLNGNKKDTPGINLYDSVDDSLTKMQNHITKL